MCQDLLPALQGRQPVQPGMLIWQGTQQKKILRKDFSNQRVIGMVFSKLALPQMQQVDNSASR